MEELIIGDKTYLSSKRAAKITGYAKDYVGQLCREGRVEARLVGRNWYVLESSIREHRFGLPEEESQVTKAEEPEGEKEVAAIEWSTPTYEVEETRMVPPLLPKDPNVDEARKVVSEMQTAWQEWFASQKDAPKTLDDGQDDFDGSLAPVLIEEPEEIVQISRLQAPQEVEEPVQEEQLVVHRSYDTHRREEVIAPTTELPQVSSTQTAYSRSEMPKRTASNLVLKAVLVGVALISVSLALVGTGAVGDLMSKGANDTTNPMVKFLSGESEYKSIK